MWYDYLNIANIDWSPNLSSHLDSRIRTRLSNFNILEASSVLVMNKQIKYQSTMMIISASILVLGVISNLSSVFSSVLVQAQGGNTNSASQNFKDFQKCLSNHEKNGSVSEQQIKTCLNQIYSGGGGGNKGGGGGGNDGGGNKGGGGGND
jgi:uncharacterized membrane protein YgcG